MTRRLEMQEVREIVIDELKARDDKIMQLEIKLDEQNLRLINQDKTIKNQSNKINILESSQIVQGMYNDYLVRAIDDQNQYQRRQNLVIDGLYIPQGAKDSEIRQIVTSHFERIKVDVYEEDIVRAHRAGRKYKDKNGKWHIPILCRFTSWWPRNVAYENRKLGKGVYLSADLTERRQDLLKELKDLHKSESRAIKLVSNIFADRNCKISVYSKDGRYFAVNTVEEFHLLLNFIEATLPPYDAIYKALHDDGIIIYQNVTNIINLNDVDDVAKTLDKENVKYIGRAKGHIAASKWQNPYSTRTFDLSTCLSMYRDHVRDTPDLIDDLESLRDLTLACWCVDGALCHGKVLLDLLAPPAPW